MSRGYFSREEEGSFYDTRDELSSVFYSCPASPATSQTSLPEENNSSKWVNTDSVYQVWTKSPSSIQERRSKFILGLNPIICSNPDSIVPDRDFEVNDTITDNIDRIFSDFGALLSSVSENESLPFRCSSEILNTSQERSSDESFECGIKNLNDSCIGAESNIQEDERTFMSSYYVQQPIQRSCSSSSSNLYKAQSRKRVGWLKKLGAVACFVVRQSNSFASDVSDSEESPRTKIKKIRVHPYKKQSKEFSAVYTGQNFKAHHGAILAMKFSPGGEYIASAGEDSVVRVWQVMECARTSEYDIPNDDPTCVYFTLCSSNSTDVSPHCTFKDKMSKSKSLRSTSDSASVVVPPVVFRISEKPLYEFYGHNGDVLDLAWSDDERLLSSSADKTVRLWQLGCKGCLKVFSHNNYVTRVQFNPTDERYFISGCIDGKVRIWEIPTCRVVNWVDIVEIVTAICYHPNGKRIAVGSMMGDCYFYDASDNHLQLDKKISFDGKKKSVEKRITGFQFCPGNSCKLMVTSADSIIRILEGFDVVARYKGLQNSRSQISAAFTSDGQHIVSASKDSKVYIWNHSSTDSSLSSNPKSIRSSECFDSSHACVAVPWQGLLSTKSGAFGSFDPSLPQKSHRKHLGKDFSSILDSFGNKILYLSPLGSYILRPEFFADILCRGSATWPEEKLPSALARVSSFGRSQFKFLRASCKKSTSHAWGQVIVTAGWDGRIKSFQNYGLPVLL